MARQATKKQKGFAKTYVETGNGTQAALKHYDTKSPEVAGVIAAENLGKPKVRALIDDFAERATRNIQTLAENAENEAVRLKANIDQVDRAGYKPIERTMNVNVEVEASKEIREGARILNELFRNGSIGDDGIVSGSMGNKAQDKE